MSHAHLFTRHSTCMGRLEHYPTPASSSPSSPDVPLFGFLPATSPVSNTRHASLKPPPPLPFPTSKSKTSNFSNWNQRPALKTLSISSRGSITKMANVSRRNTKTVVKTSLSLMETDTDMDFDRISLKKMPSSSQDVSQKRRPVYTPQFALHAEPLIIPSLDNNFEQGIEQPQIIPNAMQSLRMDCDETPATLLPCIESCRDALKRITPETMAEVLDGKYDHLFEYDLIDCRFPYEYEGGHIEGAINMITPHAMEKLFFSTSRKPAPMSSDHEQPTISRVIILHCEFSAQRAPKMGLHLRNHDRNLNMHAYPYLDYPHVFILDGGYKSFFNSFQNYCSPSGYREMNDPQYSQELKKYMGVHKAEFKRAYSTGFLRT